MKARIYTMPDGKEVKASTIPERSIESQMMAQRFSEMDLGEVLTYEEASKIIGSDARVKSRGLVYTAIKDVLDNFAIHIACIPKIGWKRVSVSDALANRDATKRMGSLARNRLRELRAMDYDSLSDTEKAVWNADASHKHLVRLSCKPKNIKKLDVAFTGGINQRIDITKTLKALGWKGDPDEPDKI